MVLFHSQSACQALVKLNGTSFLRVLDHPNSLIIAVFTSDKTLFALKVSSICFAAIFHISNGSAYEVQQNSLLMI